MKKVSEMRKPQRNRPKPLVVTVVIIIVLALLGVAFFFLYRGSFFSERNNLNLQIFRPDAQMIEAVLDEGFLPDEMFSRTEGLLVKNSAIAPFILSQYLLPGQLQSMPASQSDQINAEDQINLARVYIARGDRRDAKNLLEAIYTTFSDENGRLVGCIFTDLEDDDDINIQSLRNEAILSGPCLESTVAYLRAMLEYYDRWGTPSDWTRIEDLADLIFDGTDFFHDIAFVPSKMSELIVGLDEYEDYLNDLEYNTVYSAYRLSSLDLFAFKTLADINPEKYQSMYRLALERVQGGMLTEDLPLFARAYSDEGGGYVFFMGDEAHVELLASLKVMVHLAEVDALPASSLAWLRQQLYNNGFLYTHYDLLWGTPVTGEESLGAYGLALKVAIAIDDHSLYSRTLNSLARSRAVLDTSPARHMVFRPYTAQRNMVVAEDNLLVLLATGTD